MNIMLILLKRIKILFIFLLLLYNYNGDNMKKRKLKTKNLFIALLLILLIVFFIVLIFNKPINEFKKIGYDNNEISKIETLSEDEKTIILENEYNDKLISILNNNNYNKEKLNLYIKYSKDYDDIDIIIKYVNNYIEKNIELNDTTVSFMKEKYFIDEYFEKYLNYYENNKDLYFSEIITRINSNLDYEFYEDSKEADITKGMYTLVNKYFYLDKNYVPDNLVQIDYKYAVNNTKLNKDALDNFIKMADAAKDQNLNIKATTAYRDYNFQSTLYYNYVRIDGVKNADTYSARPGYSEHQLGYSTDLTNGNMVDFGEFEYTNEFKWLQDNAHKYGFILRYPKGKEYITGYIYEPWHYRYVGVDIATYIYENNITYEEYYAYFLR